MGDTWILGPHRIHCDSALDEQPMRALVWRGTDIRCDNCVRFRRRQ